MGLKGKGNIRWRRLFHSFRFASYGIKHVIIHEQNMRIHLAAGILVLLAGFLLGIPKVHWLLLLLTIGGVWSLEILNTAIERTVDLVTDEYHPLAKAAKDIAAAGVFVFSLIAVIVGIVIFLEPLRNLFIK
ncbi:diacylglycerol kinase family protein [Thalassorhabdus alkalitolerans]|uniref:Diacylglycerol kinase family protein n=1 Tax=Thalassorhabdus alkalitolerans TaxID=2282697 RepID=A0ABW0YPR3_9BACI|nr:MULTISPECIES: diacylglycerol kinase family protein [Bacillaceae]